jgi:hypothetical protein
MLAFSTPTGRSFQPKIGRLVVVGPEILKARKIFSVSFLEISKNCYFCHMSIYSTNTQFNTRFWVDMRYGVAYVNKLAARLFRKI